jgi:AhpD family alkylhydroperoxidase
MDRWLENHRELSNKVRSLRGDTSEIMDAFSKMANAASVKKVLDTKSKELIALGISVAVRCDDCITFHAKAAVDNGATKEEVIEVLGMAIYMGAGPSVMYASHALEAFKQFEATSAKPVKP